MEAARAIRTHVNRRSTKSPNPPRLEVTDRFNNYFQLSFIGGVAKRGGVKAVQGYAIKP
jgi:hypothetical protein